MSYQYVRIDGQRVEVNVAAAYLRLKADFEKAFPGVTLLITSGTRTAAEQKKLRDAYLAGRGGLAAPVGRSNHEETGPRGPRALDIRDSGRDPGVTRFGTARAKWLRKNAASHGFDPAGYWFSQVEPWHYEYTGKVGGTAPTPAGDESRPNLPDIPTPAREEPDMATGIIYTDDTADKNRSGAIINTDSGFVSKFGWFTKAYANNLARGFGLPAAGQVTRGQYDQILKDMADLRARES